MSISNEFEQAKSRLNTLTKEPDNDTKLKLYALFKQVTYSMNLLDNFYSMTFFITQGNSRRL